MISIKPFFITEKEEKDVIHRRESVVFLDKLIRYLKSNLDKKLKKLTDGTGGYGLHASDIDRSYKDLILFFYPDKSRHQYGFGGSSSKIKIIQMPILKDKHNLDDIDTRLWGRRSFFIHEFIHYIDDRRKKTNKSVGSALALRTGGEFEYINTPSEYNAYYQAGAEELASFLASSPRAVVKSVLTKSFREFLATKIGTFWPGNYLVNLNPKYKQKFIKRVANLYTELMKKYLDI